MSMLELDYFRYVNKLRNYKIKLITCLHFTDGLNINPMNLDDAFL